MIRNVAQRIPCIKWMLLHIFEPPRISVIEIADTHRRHVEIFTLDGTEIDRAFAISMTAANDGVHGETLLRERVTDMTDHIGILLGISRLQLLQTLGKR